MRSGSAAAQGRPVRATALLALALALAGCLAGVLPEPPGRSVYAMPDPEAFEAGARWPAAILVLAPLAVAPRDGAEVLVLRGDGEWQSLPGVRWAAPAPPLLQELLARQVERAGLAPAALRGVGPFAPLHLHGELLAFELRDQDGQFRARASLGLRLVCARDARLLAASEPIAVESGPVPATPARAMAAMREASARLARQAVLWLARADVAECIGEAARDRAPREPD